jgi:protein SCO1
MMGRGGVMGLAVTVSVLLVGCAQQELAGFVRQPTPVVADVGLPDVSQDGTTFGFAADPGGLLLVYFGYTSCPDVCPTTLADTRTALARIGDDAERVSFAMATVDPGRDTDEVITGYVQSFLPRAHALRTDDDAALRAAVAPFGADYEVSVGDSGDVEVIHTGALYAVDDQGRLLVTWPFGTSVEDLSNDLELLLGSL